MYIKYYGINWPNTGRAAINVLKFVSPENTNPNSPSYCNWIVPSTMDCNGNPIK